MTPSDAPSYPLVAFLLAVVIVLPGCLNHFRIHPRRPPDEVVTWNGQAPRGQLLLRLEWAQPAGEGPFPAVLVHPEAGHPARQMRGILHSLAAAGYLALAVDYRRARQGVYRSTLVTWKDPSDVTAAYEILRAHPRVDPERIGLMGYSQGGVYSLLIASEVEAVRAVVAYYPVTDFAWWLEDPERTGPERFVFKLIRKYFRRASGAASDEEFAAFLDRASPLPKAETITAPVLLIHGDRDTSAGVSQSERLLARLRELDREAELLVVADAGHVFNFRDRDLARMAWDKALDWLDRHLAARPRPRP